MKLSERLEQYRIVVGHHRSNAGDPFGAFEMPGPCGERLTIIATDGAGTDWEHVSVSTRRRIPNWTEMAFVKKLFWDPEDCVVQFHPPESEYVNNYSVVLHLWRWRRGKFPMPPSEFVGVKGVGLA
jgi:hypothetical protein